MPSGLHRNSPNGLNISSIRVFGHIRDPEIPITLHPTPNIIRNLKSRRLRWAGHAARIELAKNAYRILMGKPEGKRSLGRPRRRREDNIKMDLREVGCDAGDWIDLAQGMVVKFGLSP